MTFSPLGNSLKLEAVWSVNQPQDAIVTWIGEDKVNYKLYYVQIPYTDYWREVRSTNIIQTNRARIKRLDIKSTFRFTLIRLSEFDEFPHDLFINGSPSSVYLVPPAEVHGPVGQPLVPAPLNLGCHFVDHNSVNLTWDAVHSSNLIWGYKVQIMNEQDNVMETYETKKTHLDVTDLDKGTWFGARIQAYGPITRDYSKSNFTICRTQTDRMLFFNHMSV